MTTRRYRLRIFDGQYEVLHKRAYYLVLDLDSPWAEQALGRQLAALTRDAQAANEPMDAPRLEVWDVETDLKIMDWTGS
jgi:hypothetical protein